MSEHPSWQYDEVQIGKDYNTLEEVEAYDARHETFRDVDRENEGIIQLLGLSPEHTVIEFGCGTGAFAIRAARSCTRVYAVDISETMLTYAASKAERLKIENIHFCHGGFLTYRHEASPADAIVTSTALHHIPDFWKGMALQRLNRMLKDGGFFYLSDVIFTMDNTQEHIERWLAKLEQAGGAMLRQDVETHLRREYSTFDWVIDGLLERTGFAVIDKRTENGVIGRYLCRRTNDSDQPSANS